MKEDFSSRMIFIERAIKEGREEAQKALHIDDEKAEQWWRWFKEENREVLVLLEREGEVTELEGEPGKEGEKLENLPLIVKGENRVVFEEKTYHLHEAGLYRFFVAPHKAQNLILLSPAGSPLSLLRYLSALQIHGNRHDGESLDKLKERLRNETWVSITCGTISSLAVKILREEGFQSRFVSTLTLDEWNTYNNGHSLLEALFPEDGWVLVDIDFGFLFRESGKFLSTYEFWKSVQEDKKPEFFPLAEKALDPFYHDPFFYPSSRGFNYSLYFRWKWRTMEEKWRWYRRVFQTVGIANEEGKICFFGPERKIKEYYEKHLILPEQEWYKKFYADHGVRSPKSPNRTGGI